jgi:aminoglycoside phosphotransferase
VAKHSSLIQRKTGNAGISKANTVIGTLRFIAETKQLGLGRVRWVSRPPQGCNFSVWEVRTDKGRFIRKTADTQSKREELGRETSVLAALAQGVKVGNTTLQIANPAGNTGKAFYFEYIPGVDGATFFAKANTEQRARFAEQFGQALQQIHAWNPPQIAPPSNDWLQSAVARCVENIAHLPSAFDEPFSGLHGWTKQEIALLLGNRPPLPLPATFSHGDWCIPNVLIQQGAITGIIDWSNGGYKSAGYDLATGLWTLRRNAGDDPALPRYLNAFLHGYGFAGSVADLRFFEAVYAFL